MTKDYSQGKIYKLTSASTEKIYVGSTTTPLNVRFSAHKSSFKGGIQVCKANEILCYDDCKIELIEDYPCDSNLELFTREDHFITELKSINVMRPIFDKEKKKVRDKNWYNNHIEEEQQRANTYREKNPEKVKESYKNWREGHQEQEANRQASYFANNQEALQAKHKERNVFLECPICKKMIRKYGMTTHNKIH